MHIIDTAAALASVADPDLCHILARYGDLMDLAVIYIVQPNDTLQTLEAARGWPFDGWEFNTDHGGWFELVFVICDDGTGHVVLVPDRGDIDSALLDLCRTNAQPNTETDMIEPDCTD